MKENVIMYEKEEENENREQDIRQRKEVRHGDVEGDCGSFKLMF